MLMAQSAVISSMKPKGLLIAAAVLILIIAAGYALLHHPENQSQLRPGNASPAPITPVNFNEPLSGQFTAPNNAYTFSYPASWKNETAAASTTANIVYRANGADYQLTVSPPGQINPENGGSDETQTASVIYGGKQYDRTVWSQAGKAFYITAVPHAPGATYYVMTMTIPSDHTSDYTTLFDQIGNSLKY